MLGGFGAFSVGGLCSSLVANFWRMLWDDLFVTAFSL